MIRPERVKLLNKQELNFAGEYVLYWMQASARTAYNQAFNFAIEQSQALKKPLVVVFIVDDNFPQANKRAFEFLEDGLLDVQSGLQQLGIRFEILAGNLETAIIPLAAKSACLVSDVGYTRYLQQIKVSVANQITVPMFVVESNVVVPVETAYHKAAFSAAILRPKLLAKVEEFLYEGPSANYSGGYYDDIIDGPRHHISERELVGGNQKAFEQLDLFIARVLPRYIEERSDPGEMSSSHMSAFLHFGQISPISIYKEILLAGIDSVQTDKYFDEVIVRRELAINFVYYEADYDQLSCLPNWAKMSMDLHREDERPFIYSLAQLEAAQTEDIYWNAAQLELLKTGYMHNYMRMYWGKKIIEWSATYQEALTAMIYLNDTYQLDGRDPNGYAGIMWCFGKHDRPWFEREIFGKIRYMNANGLKRKFQMDKYVERINSL